MNNMNKRTFLSLLLCVCCLSFLHAERVDMQQAGADVQGRKLNTALINSTIDRLNAHGGGTLFFPAGTYLTGSIHMKSNITLEHGLVLVDVSLAVVPEIYKDAEKFRPPCFALSVQ